MNVQQLREAIADMPGHWPVVVEHEAESVEGRAHTEFLMTLDARPSAFPSQGNQLAIRTALAREVE